MARRKSGSDSLEGSEVSSGEFDDGFDDDLMGDEEDHHKLAAMTEKEREQELYKRLELREALKIRYDIEKKLKDKSKRNRKRKRRTESTSSSDESKAGVKERSKKRKESVEGRGDKRKMEAMDALKATREARKERAEEKERKRDRKEKKKESSTFDDALNRIKIKQENSTSWDEKKFKLNASDIYSDSESDWDDKDKDKDKDDQKQQSSPPTDDSDCSESEEDRPKKIAYVDTLEQLSKIRLSRFKLEGWVHHPFFNSLCTGSFVKVGAGGGANKGKPIYILSEVIGVVEKPLVYDLGPTRTNKVLHLRHGGYLRLEYVSNQLFHHDEFRKWKDHCIENGIVLPTLEYIKNKEKEIQAAVDYQLKDEDVEYIVREKQRFRLPPVNLSVTKTRLMKELLIATEKGDDSRREKIAKEIQEVEEKSKKLYELRTATVSSINSINERNRKKNLEEAEKAILEELRENKGKIADDPYTRRNTRPRIVHRPKNLAAREEEAPESQPTEPEVTPVLKSLSGELEIDVDALDFNLINKMQLPVEKLATPVFKTKFSKISKVLTFDGREILPQQPIPVDTRNSVTSNQGSTRKSLNLEDYKRKRGLI